MPPALEVVKFQDHKILVWEDLLVVIEEQDLKVVSVWEDLVKCKELMLQFNLMLHNKLMLQAIQEDKWLVLNLDLYNINHHNT